MHLFSQEDIPKLTFTKSVNEIKLDLNEKMSKKSEIKLLNAKIKNLKNKCKALREESKTDRQILQNLMNTTAQLECKTNSGIEACKQVSTQLLENHGESMSFSVNQSLNQIVQKDEDLSIFSSIHHEKSNNKDFESMERILDSLSLPLQKREEQKEAIYNQPTQRSLTASAKSQKGDQNNLFLTGNLISRISYQQEKQEPLRRANTISFSGLRVSKLQRRQSLQETLTVKKSSKAKKSEKYKLLKNYIYSMICVVVLVIIFVKLTF